MTGRLQNAVPIGLVRTPFLNRVHGISDGITVSSTGVAVGLAAPRARQAGAQGMLGAAETLTRSLAKMDAPVSRSRRPRSTACGSSALIH